MPDAKQILKFIVPAAFHATVRLHGYRAIHFGFRRYCPCCRSRVRNFKAYGLRPRPDALCPVCGALERHRLASLFLQRHPEMLRDAQRVLHIAPEPPIERLMRREVADYVSLDLGERDAMLQADLTRIPFAGHCFCGVYCGHVLEHIPDDTRALTEIQRVLRPGGWAILQVPVLRRTTFEDPRVTDPAMRQRLFGQRDHVRVYGRDFALRVAAAGFDVAAHQPQRRLDDDAVERLGLHLDETVYHCRKAP